MKHALWSYSVDSLVVPNGIPRRLLEPVGDSAVGSVRQSLGPGPVLLKVARWDPHKRWRLAMDIIACLKSSGLPARLVARGGLEARRGEVLDHAYRLRLQVPDFALEAHGSDALGAATGQPGRRAQRHDGNVRGHPAGAVPRR